MEVLSCLEEMEQGRPAAGDPAVDVDAAEWGDPWLPVREACVFV